MMLRRRLMDSRSKKKYKDGQRSCPICGDALPAHQVWPGAGYRFCMKPACKEKVIADNRGGVRYVETNQVKCGATGCSNWVPEGRYAANPPVLTCSLACCCSPQEPRKQMVTCACGCGEQFLRDPSKGTKEGFFKN